MPPPSTTRHLQAFKYHYFLYYYIIMSHKGSLLISLPPFLGIRVTIIITNTAVFKIINYTRRQSFLPPRINTFITTCIYTCFRIIPTAMQSSSNRPRCINVSVFFFFFQRHIIIIINRVFQFSFFLINCTPIYINAVHGDEA